MASFSLQGEFAVARHEQWLSEVERLLKGRSISTLNSQRLDDIEIAPVYGGRSAHPAPPLFRRAAPWTIVQRVDDPDARRGNEQILKDLQGGANGLALVFAGSGPARGAGISPDQDALATLLDGVHAGMLHLRIEGSSSDLNQVMSHLASAAADTGTGTKTDISWCPDPLQPIDTIPPQAGLIADGRVWHDAGASDAQELGYGLAQAVHMLRALEADGAKLADGAGRIAFLLSAGSDIFGTISKMRAMRLLWRRVLEAAGIETGAVSIHAETSWRMMTARDVHTNMLRSGAAALAGAAGGADSITVLPFTAALGLPDSFARRVARNSQIILQDESGLALVSDPAAGSGAAEALTGQIAAKAWALFQDTEKAGGLIGALAEGQLQRQIAVCAERQMQAITARTNTITGLSDFPDLDERLPQTLPFTPPSINTPPPPSALPRLRLAQPFEALRDRAESLENQGKPTGVFMANLGQDFSPRAIWAGNFLAAGGLEASSTGGFASASEAAKAFTASGLAAACICGDDDSYQTIAGDTVSALKAAGAVHVCLAGRPSVDTGADQLIHQGCDVISALQSLVSALEARS